MTRLRNSCACLRSHVSIFDRPIRNYQIVRPIVNEVIHQANKMFTFRFDNYYGYYSWAFLMEIGRKIGKSKLILNSVDSPARGHTNNRCVRYVSRYSDIFFFFPRIEKPIGPAAIKISLLKTGFMGCPT